MKRILSTLLVFCLSSAARAQAIPANGLRPAQDEQAMREASDLLRGLNESLQYLYQSVRGMDDERQRGVARQIKAIDEKLKKHADPTGVQAAMMGLTTTTQGLAMRMRTLQGPALAQLTKDLKAVDADLSEAVGPEVLAKARGARKEGAAKGNLGSIRSALSIYYGDKQGVYPESLNALIPKYLARIPTLEIPNHPASAEARMNKGVPGMSELRAKLGDSGQWLYVGDQASKIFGTIVIDCTHVDSRGMQWHMY